MVVGVDGSAPSRRALRWAAREARLRGARLHVVHAWHYPGFGDYVLPEGTDPEAEARQLVEETVTDELGDHPDVPVEVEVRYGLAGPELATVAEGADLLVVGSRGHGSIGGLVLGSVSQQCAHLAHCPVIVVRP